MFLYVLDLFGVAVFAASGALAGIASNLDLLGIVVLASMTAVGGGTLRDILLNKHPIFWMKDGGPIYTILIAVALTLLWVHQFPVPKNALIVADAIGLAVFAISGAQVAERSGCRPSVIILMGTLTGSGGGVLRDVLSAKVPLILRQDIYASAAIAGIVIYLLLRRTAMRPNVAFAVAAIIIVVIRLAAVALGLGLPAFPLIGH